MEITQQQFETNFETLQDEEKAMVAGLIENNEPTTLQAFAKVLGITFDLPEPEPMQEPMQEPSEKISEPEQEIPQTDEMSPITREMMALGDQPTEPVATTGPIQKEGADNSGVADDVLMDAEQKSFLVNAAALKLFGYGDFVNRILKPNIKSLKERTGQIVELNAITQPQQQVQGDVPIAASNREFYIPPELAEEIGYELLEKINDRGKPETEKKLEEQKQKEQPQEPQAAMQAALGKRIGMSNGGPININKILDSIKKVETGPNTPEDKRYIHSKSAKSGAFGPHQITGGLVDDVVRLYSKEFSPEFKKYVADFKQQTDDNINMQKFKKIYRGGKHNPRLTKEIGPLVKGGGPGYIPLETHKKFYPLLLDYSLSISTNKGKITDPATIFRNWHSSSVDKENVKYVKKTMKEFNKPSPSIEIPLDSSEEDIRSTIESIPFTYSGKATGASTFEDPNRPN